MSPHPVCPERGLCADRSPRHCLPVRCMCWKRLLFSVAFRGTKYTRTSRMGVSTGQWRAAIGRWAGALGGTLCSSVEPESSIPPSFFGLVLVVILLIAGVEPNPGPTHKTLCEVCGFQYAELTQDIERREKAASEKEASLEEFETQLRERDMHINVKQKSLELRMGQLIDRKGIVKERELLLEKRERLVSERERLVAEDETMAIQEESLVSKCSGLVPDSESMTVERAGREATGETENPGGEAYPLSPEAFLEAARAGQLRHVRAFLKRGVPVEHKDEHGRTALLLAAANGHLPVVRYLITIGRAYINARDKDTGRTALHCAARNGHLHVVQYFVREVGAEVDVQTAMYDTVLHLSVKGGNLEMVRFLVLEGKANVDLLQSNWQTALHLAVGLGNLEIVRFLVLQGKTNVELDILIEPILHLAVGKGKLELVRFLVLQGKVNVDVTYEGKTALHIALDKGNIGIMRFLLQEGNANIFVMSDKRKTILHEAVDACNLEVLHLLVEAGKLDLSGKDKEWGVGVLNRPARKGDIHVVRYLVEHAKADPNATHGDKFTALHEAVMGNHLDVVMYLVLEAGASCEVRASLSGKGALKTPKELDTSPVIRNFLRLSCERQTVILPFTNTLFTQHSKAK